MLFADLVGFTSRAEQLDPEDVRALLAPYYARLRRELERFGGTVEKFIGDAVMALFGAPVSHEDDPERAVRAALAIRDWVLDQPDELQLRIAVNTGEALVVLGARPGHGEGMASGDVVNTASRLQSAAPVNGILVGELTYRATSQAIDYVSAEAVRAKGKPQPIPVWEAVEARSRTGGVRPAGARTPLVGRDHELATLVEALARARRDCSPQLITITGVPGMGKTRLLSELRDAVDADPSLIRWRQGRSLPYGDGVSLWALSEMVKAEAGILESDQAADAEAKLADAVSGVVDATDAEWVLGHLRPVVGLAGADAAADRRTEAFAAWRRFFEGLAEHGPLVLAFDDLQWADDTLIDFIDHLVDWAAGVALLVVCASRPELFERRPGWGGGKRNATTISLAPLSVRDTMTLIANLRADAPFPASLRDALIAKADGNPLYAEQYLRMLAERGTADELPLPETIQGIVAARLDALPPSEKQLLQAGAVVGPVFWPGAVLAAGSTDGHDLTPLLHTLERKDFLRRAQRSSISGETEYSFLQVLVRDVAYAQIPRAQRASRHRQVADWLGSVNDSADRAELLAHHYMSAIELKRALGQAVDSDLQQRAVENLGRAGDHAATLNAYDRAASYYRSGVDLSGAGTPEHGRLLFRLGRARFVAGDEDPALLTAASEELLACGDQETAAEAEAVLAELGWVCGDQATATQHLERARRLVEGRETSRAKAWVVSTVAGQLMTAGENAEAIRVGGEALAMAEQLGLDELRARALNSIGVAKSHSHDPSGLADLQRAVDIAREGNLPTELCRSEGNIARLLWEQGRLDEGNTIYQQAAETAARFGLDAYVRWVRGDRAADELVLGHWDASLAAAEAFIAEVEAGSPHYAATASYAARASIRLGRGNDAGARADAERALEVARHSGDRQNLYPWLSTAAHIFDELGDRPRAFALADEFLAELRVAHGVLLALDYHLILAWTLRSAGRAHELLDALPDEDSPWTHAARAFAGGDLSTAASICATMGAASQEARVRLWLGAQLMEAGRRAEALAELERAAGFYRRVDATRYLTAVEVMVPGVGASAP